MPDTLVDGFSLTQRSRRFGTRRLVALAVLVLLAGIALVVVAPRLVTARSGPPEKIAWSQDLDEAMARSQATGRPALLRFSADWCGPCALMKEQVFAEPTVVGIVRTAFVPVIVDLTHPNQAGHTIANRFVIEALPTLVVLNRHGQEVERRSGYVEGSDLRHWLKRLADRNR